MADKQRSLLMAGCIALMAGYLAGCQAQKPQAMVDPLPPPNFAGPILSSPVLVPPKPETETANKVDAAPHQSQQAVVPAPIAPTFVPAGIPRAWVPVAAPNHWKWIVIHHSATTVGGAARFDREHKSKGWDELGYHFVVGNGTDTGMGQVEVGSRWPKQKWGAHAKTPSEEFNNYGIGICLVGNFDQGRPSEAQLKSTAKLVAYLMKTYHIPASHIIGHGDTKATDCPGKLMSVAQMRRMSSQMLADAGEQVPAEPTRTASAAIPGKELLVERRAR